MYDKIIELIDKIIEGLENDRLTVEKHGVIIGNYTVSAEDSSAMGEVVLYIHQKQYETIFLLSTEHPELKNPIIELRDAMQKARIKSLEEKTITSILEELKKL